MTLPYRGLARHSLFVIAGVFALQINAQQSAPAASGARILLLPRRIVSGERATLAVLDVSGRLTPGVTVNFSNGDRFTTDATGRALFVAPLNPGVILFVLQRRRLETVLPGRKAGASSRTPYAVIYGIHCITDYGFVKSDFGMIRRNLG